MDAMAVEVRHGCKVCGKSFSSGRSLGGHMRSHLSLGEAAAEGDAAAAELVRASANGARSSSGVVGYGLRENPRKTRRLSDFAEEEEEYGGDGDGDGDGEHKVCRECGKLFASWSSLSGHMRSHASGGRDRDGDEDVGMEEEFVSEEAEAEVVAAAMEAPVLAPAAAVTAPRRRRRTMRVAAPPPAPPPPPPPPVLCGFEKEQEDVALCLLMLSRDTALWSSPAKEAPPLGSAKNKKKKQAGVPRSGNAYNSDDDSALLQHGDAKIKGRRRSSPKQQRDAAAPKRTRYECPGCGKVFSSYQALGGHRASHKRINTSCSAPKLAAAAAAAPEPSTETYASCSTLSPSASPDSVVSGFARSKAQAVAEAAVEKFGLSHLRLADDGGLYAGGAGQELEQHSAAAAAGFLDLNFPPAPPEEA